MKAEKAGLKYHREVFEELSECASKLAVLTTDDKAGRVEKATASALELSTKEKDLSHIHRQLTMRFLRRQI